MDLPLAFDGTLFVQLLVNGLTLGSLYALIALGYSMVYGILKLLNFAHGDVYMVGAFIGYGTLSALGGPLSPNIALLPLIVLMFLAAAVLMVALTGFIRWTPLGKASRAVAADREAAEMMGIDADRVIAWIFFIGSALAGIAGVLFGVLFQNVFHYMGFVAGLKGFTAAVVGGIGSIPGAMLGGLLVGLVESWAKGYLNGNVADLVVFGILIGVMLIRPQGLLGTPALQKV